MQFATDKLYTSDGKLDRNFAGKLTACFIGGSLTEGGNEWIMTVQKYFKEYFPLATVETHTLGLGGTDSAAGACRFDEEVSSKEPDVVFIEFTVNDGVGNPTNRTANTEMMLRRCFSLEKAPAIIYLHTVIPANPDTDAYYAHQRAIALKEGLMTHYRIPTVRIYDYMLRKYRRECTPGDSFTAYLLRANYYRQNADGSVNVHPYASGYHLYGEAILEQFETYGLAHFLRSPQTDISYYSPEELRGTVDARYRYRFVSRLSPEVTLCTDNGIRYSGGWTLIDDRTSGMRYTSDAMEVITSHRMNGMMYADDQPHELVAVTGDVSAVTARGASFTLETEADEIVLMFRSIFYSKKLHYYEKINGAWTLLAETAPTSVNATQQGGGQTFFDREITLCPENQKHEVLVVVVTDADSAATATDNSGDVPMQSGTASAAISDATGYAFRFGILTEKFFGK